MTEKLNLKEWLDSAVVESVAEAENSGNVLHVLRLFMKLGGVGVPYYRSYPLLSGDVIRRGIGEK